MAGKAALLKSPAELEKSLVELSAHQKTLAFARERLLEERPGNAKGQFFLAFNLPGVNALFAALEDGISALDAFVERKEAQARV